MIVVSFYINSNESKIIGGKFSVRHIENMIHSFYLFFCKGEEKVSTLRVYTSGNKHAPSFILFFN
jgi:hypothetical protein